MPRAIAVTGNTADAQAYTGPTDLYGIVLDSALAVSQVLIRDGTSATDPIVAVIQTGAGVTTTSMLPGVHISTGIFIDRSDADSATFVFYVT